MFQRYTEKARRLIFVARNEAVASGSPVIGTEHLCLGLVKVDEALMAKLLPDGSTAPLENEIREATIGKGPARRNPDLPFSDSSKRVLAYAQDAADQRVSRRIGTAHLLLALLQDAGPAARIIERHGITTQRVLRAIDGAGSSSTGGAGA